MKPEDQRHGTTRGFHAGCRELCCRRAIARYEKQGKFNKANGIARAVPAIGAQRRIQALMTLGWHSTDIAEAVGWAHRNHVLRVLKGQSGRPCTWVERKTHDRIAEVYERLSMTFPERTPVRARTATIARRKGWLPPLAWDDIDDATETPEVAPTRAGWPHLHRAEDIEWLADWGLSLTDVKQRLGVSTEAVQVALRRAGKSDVYWRLANREPDAERRRAGRAS